MRGLIGARNVQHVAKLGEEKRIIGAFLPAVAIAPTGEEGFYVRGGFRGHGRAGLWAERRERWGAS